MFYELYSGIGIVPHKYETGKLEHVGRWVDLTKPPVSASQWVRSS